MGDKVLKIKDMSFDESMESLQEEATDSNTVAASIVYELLKKLDEKCQAERLEDYNKLVDLIERK